MGMNLSGGDSPALRDALRRINDLEARLSDPGGYLRVGTVREHEELMGRIHVLERTLETQARELQMTRRRYLELQNEVMRMDVLYGGYSEGE